MKQGEERGKNESVLLLRSNSIEEFQKRHVSYHHSEHCIFFNAEYIQTEYRYSTTPTVSIVKATEHTKKNTSLAVQRLFTVGGIIYMHMRHQMTTLFR